MKAKIYCTTTAKGVQSFYLKIDEHTHFLFSQNFRKGVKEYFRHGVPLDLALDFSRAGRNTALLKTMEKLPASIQYIEKEYDLCVLRQTERKAQFQKKHVA